MYVPRVLTRHLFRLLLTTETLPYLMYKIDLPVRVLLPVVDTSLSPSFDSFLLHCRYSFQISTSKMYIFSLRLFRPESPNRTLGS